jgi:hypothetical protein
VHLAHIHFIAHKDLGLLSLVISDRPGLEVCDQHGRLWFPLYVSKKCQPCACLRPERHSSGVQRVLTQISHRERMYRSPVLLVGRQLEWLSNNRYHAGGHLVRSYPETRSQNKIGEPPIPRGPYRYSIVFVLRAHSPIPIDTDELTTSITGHFSRPINGVTAGELFKNIQAAHFNINTGMQERYEQKRKLAEKKSGPTPTV